jgi:hypothetical protein
MANPSALNSTAAARAEVDHRAAAFEFERLPRRVQIEASITLEPAG